MKRKRLVIKMVGGFGGLVLAIAAPAYACAPPPLPPCPNTNNGSVSVGQGTVNCNTVQAPVTLNADDAVDVNVNI